MKRDVEFTTEDGTRLRGVLHTPDGQSCNPGIVMAHGFSGVKEQLDHYGALFAASGFSVLLYDHRSFGTSDGSPRYEVDPFRQISDWQDAITFALNLPEFDDSVTVGVFGSSYAGGLAMVIAACDERVGTVVAQIPNVSGHRNSPLLLGEDGIAEVRRRSAVDRAARLAGGVPEMVPVFTTSQGGLLRSPARCRRHVHRVRRAGRNVAQYRDPAFARASRRLRARRVGALHRAEAVADDCRQARRVHVRRGSA